MMRRKHLPARRGNVSFNFVHGDRTYHATATRYDDGRLAEIFLSAGKVGFRRRGAGGSKRGACNLSLCSTAFAAEVLIHAVAGGPLATALELARLP